MASPSLHSPAPLPTEKTSPVVWIIVGVLGLVALAGIVVIAGGLFLVNKDKKSGKTATLNSNEIQQGKMVFKEDGKRVVIASNGDGSAIRIGENAATNLPSWLPAYPGSTPRATFSMGGGSESTAAVSFTTDDPVDKVATFYADALRNAGLTTSSNILNQDGKLSGGVVTAASPDDKRNVMVNLATGDDGVSVGITYSDIQ